MKQLHETLLYTTFHLNLAFSSIPKTDYLDVIERCYHPILDLIEEGFPVAIEATGQTLEEISELDVSFIDRFTRLLDEGKCDFIGSGYAQIVMPLAPLDVNRWNLEIGNKVYKEILDATPTIALVNEQTFSAGLVDIYREAGYGAFVSDWSNSYQYNRYPRDYLYYPQRVANIDETAEITVLWSHSIAFQKFQRYVHGQISLEEYISEFLETHLSRSEGAISAFPLYINDAEVFSYRPGSDSAGLTNRVETEWGRMSTLFGALNDRDGVRLALPSEVLRTLRTGEPNKNAFNLITLTSPETPVPCKKQLKYNPTRWAVTGRDSVHINTQCFRALDNIKRIEDKLTTEEFSKYKKSLCQLWGSDYRTNTTDEKLLDFQNHMGWLMCETQSRMDNVIEASLKPKTATSSYKDAKIDSNIISLNTDAVSIELLTHKGLAIKSLTLPEISTEPVIGTLEHGYYEDIHYGADFYSGHLINVRPDGTKVTDLIPLEVEIEEYADFVRVSGRGDLKIGNIIKSYDIYTNEARLDLTFTLKLAGLTASSLRLGIFTLLPGAFDEASLWFEAVSGGSGSERFFPVGRSFDHGAPVSPSVSATTCLGATTGEVVMGDDNIAISISSDRAGLYSVPMIKYSSVDESVFYRLSHSIGETDETAYWLWRGQNTISFTIRPA